jgi:preprotein translocase subunit SecD
MTRENDSPCVGSVCCFLACVLLGCGSSPNAQPDEEGHTLTYAVATSESVDAELMVNAIQERLDRSYVEGANVRATANGQFEVELPSSSKDELMLVRDLLRTPGTFELRILAHKQLHQEAIARALAVMETAPSPSATFWREFNPVELVIDDSMVTRVLPNERHEVLVMDVDLDLNGTYLKSALPGDPSKRPTLLASWNEEGALLMAQLTSLHPFESNFHMAIIYDGKVIYAPIVRESVSRNFEITGDFSKEEVKSMMRVLKSGPLPARLKPVASEARKASE